jgi:hypothetical protein
MAQSATYVGGYSIAATNEANASGVSWAAVIAGAFVTSALVLILLSLGAGLGLSSVSPWANMGASATGITASAIIWLIVMEALSSAMGGYIAGRLRTKWASVHSDEVYFRDTAHGFLAWSTALVFTAAFLASAATTMVGASVESKGDDTGQNMQSTNYFVDTLFRNPNVSSGMSSDAAAITGSGVSTGTAMKSVTPAQRNEAGLIFANGIKQGALPTEDQMYLTQEVTAQTGVPADEAGRRVTDAFTNAQYAVEAARKATAHTLLWIFLALLIGAFCASLAATVGGRQRDSVVTI